MDGARSKIRVAVLAMVSLVFCCGMPSIIVHGEVRNHRALYDLVEGRLVPFLRARHALRSVPNVRNISPLPGAADRYRPGLAFRWQLGDTGEVEQPDVRRFLELIEKRGSSGCTPEELQELQAQAERWIRTSTLENLEGARLIDGVYRVHVWSYRVGEYRCMRPRLPRGKAGLSELEYQMSVPLIRVLDEEVYSFSRYWHQGAFVWAKRRDIDGLSSECIFVAGVPPEVANAVEKAVKILVELAPPPFLTEEERRLMERFRAEIRRRLESNEAQESPPK